MVGSEVHSAPAHNGRSSVGFQRSASVFHQKKFAPVPLRSFEDVRWMFDYVRLPNLPTVGFEAEKRAAFALTPWNLPAYSTHSLSRSKTGQNEQGGFYDVPLLVSSFLFGPLGIPHFCGTRVLLLSHRLQKVAYPWAPSAATGCSFGLRLGGSLNVLGDSW